MENNTTFVTCYYKIKSKQKFTQYLDWINILLPNLRNPLVIYTNENTKNMLNATYKNIKVVVVEIENFYVNKYTNEFIHSHEIDINRKMIHSVDLFKIYNEKASFLKQAIENNFFKTQNFFWIDIGCFRPNVTHINYNLMEKWPNFSKLCNDKINMFSISEISDQDRILDVNSMTSDKLRTQGNAKIVGGFFGGNCTIMLFYIEKYYELLEQWAVNNKFIGIDNYIMTNIFLKFPLECNLLTKQTTNMTHIKDTHMWFQNYLAH